MHVAKACPVYTPPNSNHGQCTICQTVINFYIVITCNSGNYVDGSGGTGATDYQLNCLSTQQWDTSNGHSCMGKLYNSIRLLIRS